jgi:hypothetical protein
MDRHQSARVPPTPETPPQACERETEAKDHLPGYVKPGGGSGTLAIWHSQPLNRFTLASARKTRSGVICLL